MSNFETTVVDESGSPKTFPYIVETTVTTASDGTFTADFTDVGLTTVYGAFATGIAANSSLGNALSTSIYTLNTTTVTGIAYVHNTAVLGVLGIQAAGSGETIKVTVIGN